MGNSFVLFDVSIVISHGQFHCGNRGHTQNADFPWVKSHFPVGKRSSGTTANVKSGFLQKGKNNNNQMLERLLAKRCKLKTHRASLVTTIFELP